MDKMILVARRCPFCCREYSVEVPEKGFLDWLDNGVLIQKAMPDISAEVRESLMTGMCKKCQDDVFGG